jgi:hypothetical protein
VVSLVMGHSAARLPEPDPAALIRPACLVDEVDLNPVAIGPGVHDTTGKFTPVVDGDRARDATLPHDQF